MNKEILKELTRIAQELPAPELPIRRAIKGSTLIDRGIPKIGEFKTEDVDPNKTYSAGIDNNPEYHLKRLKKAYKMAGYDGVRLYTEAVKAKANLMEEIQRKPKMTVKHNTPKKKHI